MKNKYTFIMLVAVAAALFPVFALDPDEITDPHAVLTLNIFTKKNLNVNITPTSQPGLAGSTLNYRLSLENKNPKPLVFKAGAQIPEGWEINVPEEIPVPQQSARDVIIRVTSNETASDNAYPIIISLQNEELGLAGNVEAEYVVASRGAPGVNVTPRSKTGIPGQALSFNVTVRNNDPQGFDASTISLRAVTPSGFNAVFTPSSLKVAPGADASVDMSVTSPSNASDIGYTIIINATANRLSGMDAVEYKVDLCGNGVCDLNEESTCFADCPYDPYITCDGRCERELDDGLRFSAAVSVPFTKFIVCNRNVSIAACNEAARQINGCGIGRACLCADSRASCDARCVDRKGVYYMIANGTSGGVRSIANYSYACPWVDMPDFTRMRDSFTTAKEDYEKAQSSLREFLKGQNITVDQKIENQPCVDSLSSIIGILDEFVGKLNRVIAWPGKLNTTAARADADNVRSDIETTYNRYCRGASGLLQIESISAQTVEKGSNANVIVTVGNLGNVDYYGYVQCEITGAAGEKSTATQSCDLIGSGSSKAFSIPVQAGSAGTWKARCRTFGSLISDCGFATTHDDKTGNFTVFTREAFVVDVAGACTGNQVTCSVRTSRAGCGTCSLGGTKCRKAGSTNATGSNNATDNFICDIPAIGTYNLVGSIVSNSQCKPAEPASKNVTVRCAGCGDNSIDSGEQCELPYTNDNQKCSQEAVKCQGKLFGSRDKAGFCSASCTCIQDEFQFSCTRGQCGAECQDGETRIVTLNKTGGSCACRQQCGSACTWNACDCEVGQPGPVGLNVSAPTVQVAHVPQSPTQTTPVTITATGQGATSAEIYVDGFLIKSCASFPCSVTATYDPGVHSYFARAINSAGIDTDPDTGTKSFTIPGIPGSGSGGPGGSGGVNGSGVLGVNGTFLNTSTLMLDVSHSPAVEVGPSDTVTVSAVGYGLRSFREINIFIDGTLKKTCTNYPRSLPCTYRSTYSEGGHTYFATAVDTAGNAIRDPSSGTETFVVSSSSDGGGGTTTTGNGTRGTCYVKLDSKSCVYNTATRRYDVYVTASWDNGTHAHWDIDDNAGPKIYAKKFNRTEPQSGPGLKNVKILVHNETDATLCLVSDTIYCGPGSASGRDVDVIYDVKNVVRLGITDVRIIITSYKDIGLAYIKSYVESGINVSDVAVSGNKSVMGISGPQPVFENKSYTLYTLSGGLQAGNNITLSYRMLITRPGDYSLMATANYSGKTEKYTKRVIASDCPEVNSVLARSGDVCRDFVTRCDVPAGWNVVSSCDQELQPVEQKQDSPVGIAIALLVIVIILAAGYKYREQIKEKLDDIRERIANRGEEDPSLRFEE